MGEFLGFICAVSVVVMVTVAGTEYNINSEETSKLLSETCAKNGGINTTKIAIDAWKFKCNNGAVFVVDRK